MQYTTTSAVSIPQSHAWGQNKPLSTFVGAVKGSEQTKVPDPFPRKAELEITAGHRPFFRPKCQTTDQVPICLNMNPIGFLLCPGKTYHAMIECPTKTQSLFLVLPLERVRPASLPCMRTHAGPISLDLREATASMSGFVMNTGWLHGKRTRATDGLLMLQHAWDGGTTS